MVDPARRAVYDQRRLSKFGLEEANKIFLRFFNENIPLEYEESFLQTNYPERMRTYYEILGVRRNASMDEIKNAYRKLALKYNPKVCKDKDSERRFIEINEAFSHLSDEFKRRQYDQYTFGELLPTTAYNIFSDFFSDRDFVSEADKKLLKPVLKQTNKLINRLANRPLWNGLVPRLGYETSLMGSPLSLWNSDLSSKFWDVDLIRPIGSVSGDTEIDIESLGPDTQFAESFKKSVVHTKGPKGQPIGKTITEKSELKNGKKCTIRTEEILKEDGTKEIIQTVKDDQGSRTNTFNLAVGQERPDRKSVV